MLTVYALTRVYLYMQCYYNLQECDCSSESDYSLQEVDVDYVNVLPRGWFSSGDSVGVFMQGHLEENRLGARLEEGSLCSEFMQGHLKEEGSLCSECECNEPSDLISVNSQASLCTECELQELQLYTTSWFFALYLLCIFYSHFFFNDLQDKLIDDKHAN